VQDDDLSMRGLPQPADPAANCLRLEEQLDLVARQDVGLPLPELVYLARRRTEGHAGTVPTLRT
jgi:hypothetical protein